MHNLSITAAARECLYAAGFSPFRPSFRVAGTHDGRGAIVEIVGEILASERVALAMDVLGERWAVARCGQRLLVLPRRSEVIEAVAA